MNRLLHHPLPEDVRRLCGSLQQDGDLRYLEIVRNEDARQAIERWAMFQQLQRHGLIGSRFEDGSNRTAEN